MRFTKYYSLHDILCYPQMYEYLKLFFDEKLLAWFPTDRADEPVARLEQELETSWGDPFPVVADQLADSVNLILDLLENHTRRAIALWDPLGGDWNLEREKKGGKNKVFLIAPAGRTLEERIHPKEKRKAVIICPGGGYEQVCFSGEGTPVMEFMEARGYVSFILRYRTGKEGAYPNPQTDLALAVRYVRLHAKEYGIDPEDILLLGASAGGHLCASFAALYRDAGERAAEEMGSSADLVSVRPDKLCLCYPVISFIHEPHEGSARIHAGESWTMREKLSAENLVADGYPPVFLWACADDDCVPPSNAERMARALEEAGVPFCFKLYPSGGHGCSLAFPTKARGWTDDMAKFFRTLG